MPKTEPAMGSQIVPVLRTDDDAEAFLMQDLCDFELSQFKRHHFEFEKKEAQINMRVPQPLLDAVKDRAKSQGIASTRYIRLLMERDIAAK